MKTASLVVALGVLVSAVACGGSGPDRGDYVRANEAVFHQLPVFPGARLREEVSSPARAEEDGPVVGYTTRFDFDLRQGAHADDVALFFERRLEPQWRLVEKLDGPVLNFRKGRSLVSINLERRRAIPHFRSTRARSGTPAVVRAQAAGATIPGCDASLMLSVSPLRS